MDLEINIGTASNDKIVDAYEYGCRIVCSRWSLMRQTYQIHHHLMHQAGIKILHVKVYV